MSSRIRVGVVGQGFGRAVHVPAFRMDPRFEVTVLCGTRGDKLKASATELGIAKTYLSWQDLISDREIDLVAIAVPPQVQVPILEAAISAKKHVFAEKPLGCGSQTAEKLARAADQAGLVHAVDFEFREIDVWKKANAMLRSGELGPLRHAVVSWHIETLAQKNRDFSSWKVQKESGGTLNHFVSHVFYYLDWLCGEISGIEARLDPHPVQHPEHADDLVQLLMRTRQGLPITVSVSSHSRGGNGHRIEIYGEKGALKLENPHSDYMKGFTLEIRRDPSLPPERLESELKPHSPGDGRVLAVGSLLKRFADAIESKNKMEPSLWDGAKTERCIERARLSAKRGWNE